MKPCVFCAGVEGRVYEDDEVLAFLDHRPVFFGHVLLIPRRHMVTLDELRPSEVGPLFEKLRVMSRAVPRAMGGEGCFVANNNVISQSVPHLHWHLVPRRKKDGLKGFFWPRQPYRDAQHQEEVRRAVERTILQELILDFWFGPPGEMLESFSSRWFMGGPTFDAEIRRRFEPLVERALAGEFVDWEDTPRGRLALVLMLDQFTRNLYRHTARAFAGDPRAQALALSAVDSGMDRSLGLYERVFMYLPFEHGESPEWQQLSLRQFESLAAEAGGFDAYLDYARRHAEIIERWGRYPHRNLALGRASTAAEEDFLKQPGSSFW